MLHVLLRHFENVVIDLPPDIVNCVIQVYCRSPIQYNHEKLQKQDVNLTTNITAGKEIAIIVSGRNESGSSSRFFDFNSRSNDDSASSSHPFSSTRSPSSLVGGPLCVKMRNKFNIFFIFYIVTYSYQPCSCFDWVGSTDTILSIVAIPRRFKSHGIFSRRSELGQENRGKLQITYARDSPQKYVGK